MFVTDDGFHAVIKIETENAINGIHKVVKYNALRCIEQGKPRCSEDVVSYLVTLKSKPIMTEKTNLLCEKYDVIHLEINL